MNVLIVDGAHPYNGVLADIELDGQMVRLPPEQKFLGEGIVVLGEPHGVDVRGKHGTINYATRDKNVVAAARYLVEYANDRLVGKQKGVLVAFDVDRGKVINQRFAS